MKRLSVVVVVIMLLIGAALACDWSGEQHGSHHYPIDGVMCCISGGEIVCEAHGAIYLEKCE